MLRSSFILFICWFCLCSQSMAQAGKMWSKYESSLNKLIVHYHDTVVETHYFKGDKKIKTKLNKFYYWYAAKEIKRTQGSFDGLLLHGTYKKFTHNKDLIQSGSFAFGLKHGEWLTWNQEGVIISKEHWKKGVLDGKVHEYYNNGQLKSISNYRQNSIQKTKSFDETGKKIKKKSSKEKVSKEKKVKIKKEKVKKDGKVKDGKNKKVKIYKFRQILPGGQGAFI